MTTALTVSTGTPLVPTSYDWEAEVRGATMLLKSGFVPASVKSAEQALFIVLTGRDLGLSPVQSLRSINVIQGKIEVAADMQLGLFKRAGGRAQFRELTEHRAVLWLRHPNGDEHVETFSMEDAKRAGLASGNYQKFPKAMLRSRAITAGLKSIGFDPLAGAYDEGEIGGPAPVLERDADEIVADVEVIAPDETGELPTEEQKKLYTNVMSSSVWSDEERAKALAAMTKPSITKAKMTDMLDRALSVLKDRKEFLATQAKHALSVAAANAEAVKEMRDDQALAMAAGREPGED